MYGLAVEHTLGDLTQWSGERGRTYFYQSELPYDVTQSYGDAGYVGYRVNDTVRQHEAFGVGVYHYFRDFDVTVPRGIAAPPWLANSFELPLGVYLSGRGTMLKVLNDFGGVTTKGKQTQWVCEKGPDVPYTGTVPKVPAAQPIQWAPTSSTRVGFVSFEDAGYTLDRAAALTDELASAAHLTGDSKEARHAVQWWVYLVGVQSVLLVVFSVYQLHLHRRSSMSPVPSTPSASPNPLQAAWPSRLRLRNLSGGSVGAPSPGAHSDAARSLGASPTESGFVARSPTWSPGEL